MKIKQGYVVKTIADTQVIVPISNPNFKSVVTINDSGAFLFNKMNEDISIEDLANALAKEYEIDYDTAYADSRKFADMLRKASMLDE